MRLKSRTTTRGKPAISGLFEKRAYSTCLILTALLGLIHFRDNLFAPTLSSAYLQEDKRNLLDGSILFFAFDNTCHQRIFDNATGRSRDNGLVDCGAATAQSTAKWAKQMGVQQQTRFRDAFLNR